MGLADSDTREVSFDRERVCDPIVEWRRTGRVSNWTVSAIVTVGHEAAHLRSVHNESKAECLGVHFADAYMSRQGIYRSYVRSEIVAQLMDNSPRPKAYWLSPSRRW